MKNTLKKKIKGFFLIFLFSFLILIPFIQSQNYNNYLTRSVADYVYCLKYGDCWLNKLIVQNLTVENAINLTVTNYNVTGDIYIEGNIFLSGKLNNKQIIYNNTIGNYNITAEQINVTNSFYSNYSFFDRIKGYVTDTIYSLSNINLWRNSITNITSITPSHHNVTINGNLTATNYGRCNCIGTNEIYLCSNQSDNPARKGDAFMGVVSNITRMLNDGLCK